DDQSVRGALAPRRRDRLGQAGQAGFYDRQGLALAPLGEGGGEGGGMPRQAARVEGGGADVQRRQGGVGPLRRVERANGGGHRRASGPQAAREVPHGEGARMRLDWRPSVDPSTSRRPP